uniref:TIR domain-containing protein n=1 Tax=Candidatus Kentrum sp. TUN TaxID=2126343 RepID=A0A451A3F0_9GAMM|nr:MAG: TIR domain-containing protein [Candidatus Kentron sp. TUN]
MPDRSISKPSPSRRSKPAEGKRFAAFISYKHVSSTSFAARLERALKSYAKPPLVARPRRIFRDENYLAPGVDLPRLIKEALDNSEFLLLLASPESAQSKWVQDELDLWCRVLKRQEQLIVILLGGDIKVDDQSKQIDWSGTDALPTFMAEHLTTVPLYLDLRELARLDDIDLNDPSFKRAINGIVARFRGIDPNEMLGEEIRQRRRALRLKRGGIAALVVLTMLAGGFWFLAEDRLDKLTERERDLVERTRHGAKLGIEKAKALAREDKLDEALNVAIEAGESAITAKDPQLTESAAVFMHSMLQGKSRLKTTLGRHTFDIVFRDRDRLVVVFNEALPGKAYFGAISR